MTLRGLECTTLRGLECRALQGLGQTASQGLGAFYLSDSNGSSEGVGMNLGSNATEGRSRDLLLAHIARLYYIQGETQQSIADMLSMSRPQISRLLAQARTRGIVKISIEFPDEINTVGERLKEAFHLTETLVVPTPEGGDAVLRNRLGTAAAELASKYLRPGMKLGVAWGRTLASTVSAMKPDRSMRLKVVQMIGGVCTRQAGIQPNEIVWTLAELYDSECYYLHAPAIVENSDMREAFVSSLAVRQTLEQLSDIEIAILGIGTISPTAPVLEGSGVTDRDIEDLKRAGAVGDVCTRFFDIEGQECSTSLRTRSIAISLEQLKAIPTVIGVAGGSDKVIAILGALRGGLVTVLVTDEATARELLNHADAFAVGDSRIAASRM